MSERRACQLIGYCRMTVRYVCVRGRDEVLRDRIQAIAELS
jgi:putative transposase